MILRVKVNALKAGASVSAALGALGVPVAAAIKEINTFTSKTYPPGIKIRLELTSEANKLKINPLPMSDAAFLKINSSEDAISARAKETSTPKTYVARIKILQGVKKSLNVKA